MLEYLKIRLIKIEPSRILSFKDDIDSIDRILKFLNIKRNYIRPETRDYKTGIAYPET
jgi:hypothetical protein